MPYPFQTVDVFGELDFSGNPLAVVAAADDLDAETMQRVTRWLNLSETTFLLRPTVPAADYRVRIFCPTRELPFAGHPTLGSCHAWLGAGGRPKRDGRIVQQCGVGLVQIRQSGDLLAFAAPGLIRAGPVEEGDLADAAAVLRVSRAEIVDAQWVDNGPGWLGIMLASAEAVLALEPARQPGQPVTIGVVGAHPAGAETGFEIRAFFSDPNGALIEDPVTGSLNASIAQWMFASGRASSSYVAAQGTRLGRTGRVRIDRDETGQVWVGGQTRTLVAGQMTA